MIPLGCGRPTIDAWLMEVAQVVAKRSTCLRRSVGCVLANRRGHQLSTGYNGVAAGMAHCNDLEVERIGAPAGAFNYPNACPGALAPKDKPQSSGTGCEAIHAEQNALLQCRDVGLISTCYVTLAPCVTCAKLLLNTSCRRIVFLEPYVEEQMAASRSLWERAGREWIQLV